MGAVVSPPLRGAAAALPEGRTPAAAAAASAPIPMLLALALKQAVSRPFSCCISAEAAWFCSVSFCTLPYKLYAVSYSSSFSAS
jgi:hypothetical protein